MLDSDRVSRKSKKTLLNQHKRWRESSMSGQLKTKGHFMAMSSKYLTNTL